ncbi:MAG: TonB-dependent receptor [Bacteroidetes bacterium]|nr:TonB-dependent receptor [Bacteroidota bacterium]
MKNTYNLKSMLSAILIIMCCNLFSQTDSTDLTDMSLEDLLDVRVTTASKISQEAKKAPAQIIVITEEQIRVRGYRSLLDVLTDLPDIKVDNKAYGMNYNTFTVRGMQGQEKFIIMLDGMRISGPANETMPIIENYPVNLAKQIEVVYGPASALYGADAVSGVINIITKKTELKTLKAEASAQAGDNGLYNGTLFASSKLSEETILTLSGQYFFDQGVNLPKIFGKEDTLWNMDSHKTGTFNTAYGPMTPSKKVNSKYEAPLMAYNIYAGLITGDFKFTVFRNYSKNSSALENNPNNAVHNKDVFYGRSINAVEAQYSKTSDKITSISSITASDYRTDPLTNYRNVYNNLEGGYKYSYSTKVKIEQQIEWRVNSKLNLVSGALFENFFVMPEGTDLQDPVRDNKVLTGTMAGSASYYRPNGIEATFFSVHYNNSGVYSQLQYTPNKKLAFTLGGRYDYNTRYGSTLNPRVGMVASLSKSTTFKFLSGTSYLAPTPGTAYSYYGSFSTSDSGKTYQSYFMHLPNPNLEPMHVYNAEFSLQQRFLKRFQVQLTGYTTLYTNIIELASDAETTKLYNGKFMGYDVDYIEVYVNVNKQQNTGGSLRMEYSQPLKKGRLDVYGTVSYVDGKVQVTDLDDGGDNREVSEIDFISPFMFKGGTDLILDKFSFSARCIVSGKQRIYTDDEATQKRQTIDGYTVVNASIGYKIGKVSLFVNVSNLLNSHYKNVSYSMNLSDPNTPLFRGNWQDPLRINGGIKITL